MHKTIWLLALILMPAAMNSGKLPNGLIINKPAKKKKNTKNIDLNIIYESREPKRISSMGVIIEKETTPVGVTFRWDMLIASCKISSLFLSGLTFNIFSLKEHSFS